MARLYRPHIPLVVRIDVVHRQLQRMGKETVVFESETKKSQLDGLLRFLAWQLRCEPADLRLDHDPALCNRQQFHNGRGEIVRYVPDANDPAHLIYRTKADHDIKTRVRGDGAQHSDLALRRIAKRRERKAARGKLSTSRLAKPAKRRNKKPWPTRPMPKGRGFPKRRG